MSPSQPPPPPSHGSPASSHSSSSSSGSGGSQPPAPHRAREAGRPPTTSSSPPPSSAKPRHSTVGVFSKRKGVRYRRDGQVLSCRFCEILRLRDEQFVYENEQVVVFRPLRPIVASHILIVPRAHIRNVSMLASGHEALLRRMKRVAERVLLANPSFGSSSSSTGRGGDAAATGAAAVNTGSSSLSDNDAENDPLAATPTGHPEDSKHSEESSKCTDDEDSCSPNNNNKSATRTIHSSRRNPPPALKFAFHVPPFNSIDHVHMHAFWDEPRRMGVFGRIKYRTESWWCRSYDDVLARVSGGDFVKEAAPHDDNQEEEEPLDNDPPSVRANSSMKRHTADTASNQRC